MGFRYNVGNDYHNYVDIYENLDWYMDVFEPGYILLCQFSQKLNLTYQFPFFICSLLTVLPIAFLVNKTIPRMFCTSMTVYVLSYVYFEAMNTVRQAVAMSAFLLVFYFYIIKEQKLKALLALIFGALFHKSILIIAFLAFVISKFRDKFNIKLCLILLLGSFVIGHCLQSFFDAISGLTMLLGLNSNYMDVFEERGVASGTFQIYLNISALYLLIFNKKQFSQKNRRNQIIALFLCCRYCNIQCVHLFLYRFKILLVFLSLLDISDSKFIKEAKNKNKTSVFYSFSFDNNNLYVC